MDHIWKRKPGKEALKVKESKGVEYLSFECLEKTGLVAQGFSTKYGGVSEGCFASMNLTFNRGDNPEHVTENYHRMAAALQIDENTMVLSHQTHTTNIRKVTSKDAGKGLFRDRDYTDIDGLITDERGITLVTFYADCVPLYILDPIHPAIGLSHSGWRGTVASMGKETLKAMAREYGTKSQDVIVCIGPSICQECYEVDEDVAVHFRESFAPSHWNQLLTPKENGKYQLNLWKANELIFLEAGVPAHQIHITDICTHCNPDHLYSHRRTGNERGNLAAFLQLKKEY